MDLTGKRFGRLLVVSQAQPRGVKLCWNCRCDCGRTKEIRGGALTVGLNPTRSCGCLTIEAVKKHGHAFGSDKESATYRSWCSMHQRCNDSKNSSFHRYGERGIKVCARWSDFRNFLADMGERPDGKTLERRNNKDGYSKGNCSWATPTEQNRNRSNAILIALDDGTKVTQKEFAKLHGVTYAALRWRMSRGLSAKEACMI